MTRQQRKEIERHFYNYEQERNVCAEYMAERALARLGMDYSQFVSPRYRKQGLSYALLEVATVLGGTRLAARKCNTKALHAYKKFGFEIFDESDEFYFMRLSEEEKE